MPRAVILSAVRTPVGRYGGSLSGVRPDDLAAHVIAAAVERAAVDPAEVADVFETPFAFLMDPDNHERRFRDLDDGRRRHFYAMPYEDRLIWGATAGMLRILYERLYGPAAAAREQQA